MQSFTAVKNGSSQLTEFGAELLATSDSGHLSDRSRWCLVMLQDAIVPVVMPFVQENIGKNTAPEDWRFREAATFAFGSILEGPSPRSLADTVRQAMGFLLAVSAGRRTYYACYTLQGSWEELYLLFFVLLLV